MNNTVREYKMRADCQSDADLIRACLAPWLERWQVSECHLEHEGKPFWIPDVVIEFTIAAEGPTKGELKWLINSIDDCHVAAESLDGAAEYTGKRYYLEDSDCVVTAPEPKKLKEVVKNLERYREYLEVQSERRAEARDAFEGSLAIARLSACAKARRPAANLRRATAKR